MVTLTVIIFFVWVAGALVSFLLAATLFGTQSRFWVTTLSLLSWLGVFIVEAAFVFDVYETPVGSGQSGKTLRIVFYSYDDVENEKPCYSIQHRKWYWPFWRDVINATTGLPFSFSTVEEAKELLRVAFFKELRKKEKFEVVATY